MAPSAGFEPATPGLGNRLMVRPDPSNHWIGPVRQGFLSRSVSHRFVVFRRVSRTKCRPDQQGPARRLSDSGSTLTIRGDQRHLRMPLLDSPNGSVFRPRNLALSVSPLA